MQHQLTIPYDDAILVGLGLSPEQFVSEARFMLAAKFYEQGKLTSGQACSLLWHGPCNVFIVTPSAWNPCQ